MLSNNKNTISVIGSIGFNGVAMAMFNWYIQPVNRQFNYVFIIKENNHKINKKFADIIYGNGDVIINISNNKILYLVKLFKVLHKYKPIVTHINGSSSFCGIEAFIATLAGIPNRIIHSHNTFSKSPILHTILKPFNQIFSNNRISCSIQAGKWMFYSNYSIIYNGIDFEKYSFNPFLRKKLRSLHQIDNKIVLLNISNFTTVKNIPFLINVFRQLIEQHSTKEYHLILIGDGEDKNLVISLVEEYGLVNNITFVNFVNDVESYYSAADYFIFPSIKEGLPMVLIESQINGLPIIISSSITEEAIITKYPLRISLTDNVMKWSNQIADYLKQQNRSNLIMDNKSSKFSIQFTSKEMEAVYAKHKGVQ